MSDVLTEKKVSWVPLLVAAAAFLTLFYSYLFLPEAKIPSDYPDGRVFAWNFWWARYALEHGLPLFFTEKVFHPHGASLVMHTFMPSLTIPAVLLLPASWSPWQLFTATALLCISLNIYCAYRLFLTCSEHRGVALCCALLFGLHPFFMGHLQGGHLNFLVFFPVLLVINILFCGVRRRRISNASLGLLIWSVVILSWANLYYFYFMGMICASYGVFLLLSKSCSVREWFRVFLFPLTCALFLCVPRLYVLLRAAHSGSFTPHHDPLYHSADIISYLVPGPQQWSATFLSLQSLQGLSAGPAENGLAISMGILLALFLAGVYRSMLASFFVFLAFLFAFMSFGPVISLAGEPLLMNPVYAIMQLLPQFPSTPVRFGVMVFLCLLIAVTLRSSRDQGTSKVILCCLLFSLVELYPIPPASYEVSESQVVQHIAQSKADYALLDWSSMPEDAMARQMVHERPIVRAFLARRPIRSIRKQQRNRFIRFLIGTFHGDKSVLAVAFRALNIDGVLVSASDLDAIERLQSLSFLSVSSQDEQFVLFEQN